MHRDSPRTLNYAATIPSLQPQCFALSLCFLICDAWTPSVSAQIYKTLPAVVAAITEQQSASDSHSDATFLALIIRLQRSHPPEIEKATQVSGKLITATEPSSKFIYEITRDDQPFVVGFLPEDPLLLRSFRDPKTQGKEQVGHAKSATITLNIPDTDASAATRRRIGIRFYAVRQGTDVRRIDPEVFKKLLADSKISLQFELDPSTISNKLRSQNTN